MNIFFRLITFGIILFSFLVFSDCNTNEIKEELNGYNIEEAKEIYTENRFLYKFENECISTESMKELAIVMMYFMNIYDLYLSLEVGKSELEGKFENKISVLMNFYKNNNLKISDKEAFKFLKNISHQNKTTPSNIISTLNQIGVSKKSLMMFIKLFIGKNKIVRNHARRAYFSLENHTERDFIIKIREFDFKEVKQISKLDLPNSFNIEENQNRTKLFLAFSKNHEITEEMIGTYKLIYSYISDLPNTITNQIQFSDFEELKKYIEEIVYNHRLIKYIS
jgi:hypothetical protein